MDGNIWIVLLPVIVGGLLALLPGVVAQIFTHFLGQAAAAKAERRTRFEKLSQALWDYENWVDEQRLKAAFGTAPAVRTTDPLSTVMTIAIMDFPEIVSELDELQLKFFHYSQWYTASGMKRLNGDIATMNDGFQEAYAPFRGAFGRTHKALRDVAKSLG